MPVNIEDSRLIAPLKGSQLRKFGRNLDVPTGGNTLIWPLGGTTYPWPTDSFYPTVESSDAEDIGKTILVLGLDENGLEHMDTIVIGAAPVAGTSLFYRIYRLAILGRAQNVGNVLAKNGADILALIEAGFGQTQQLIYTVPANKLMLLSQLFVSTGAAKGVNFELWLRSTISPFSLRADVFIEAGSFVLPFDPASKITALSDMYMTADPDQAGGVSGQFFGYLYQSEYDPRTLPGFETAEDQAEILGM